ncbi:MAG: NERD domain-containing protein [Anaerolineae bacterium]|jgi:hypothetical protein
MADRRGTGQRQGDDWLSMADLSRRLREALSRDYAVVTEARIYGEDIDAIVVGPQGLYVLATVDWAGRVHTARTGQWEVVDEAGQRTSYPNPAPRAQRAQRAVRSFMRDEYPRTQVPVQALLVLTSRDAQIETYGATDPPAVHVDNLSQEIMAIRGAAAGDSLDQEAVEKLARALRERELASRQRASRPFVFRSGGVLGSGRKAWTIREAVRHIDRHPDDGAYHLRNGTLERWFRDQGARHLAVLAREATSEREGDARIAVERFLIGTGLVRRPKVKLSPQRADLGYVLPGEDGVARLRIRKGVGRGYLVGKLHTSEPWLRVEPSSFSEKADLRIWASSDTLTIQGRPHQAAVLLNSTASEHPISVPARLRVVGTPHKVNRWVIRPAVGLILGLVFGAALGVLIANRAIWSPSIMARLGLDGGDLPEALFGVLVGVSWAVLGAWRGFRQRLSWPVGYATGRWLLQLGIWTLALSVIAAAGLAALVWITAIPVSLISNTGLLLGLGALALANVPATVSEVRASMEKPAEVVDSSYRRAIRPLRSALIGVVAIVVIGVGAFALEPFYRRWVAREATENLLLWVGDQSDQLGAWVDRQLDRMYLERYDRRAPTRVPAASDETAGE